MCLAIPSKIVSIDSRNIIVNELGEEKKVKGSLVDGIEEGDYVLLQNEFIVRRISKKQAKEIISLLDISSKARYKFN